jgi:hypothetical protein
MLVSEETEPLVEATIALIVAADEEGTYAFDLVDGDTLDYCYAESGRAARVTCARLQRQK